MGGSDRDDERVAAKETAAAEDAAARDRRREKLKLRGLLAN